MRDSFRPGRRRVAAAWVPLLIVVLLGPSAALTVSRLHSARSPSTTIDGDGSAGSGTTLLPLPVLHITRLAGSDMDLPGPQFGIAYGDVLPWMTPGKLTAALRDAAEAGATWVRLDFSWADVQPKGPNSYRWARLDRVVRVARSLGLHLLPTLAYTPRWARPRDCHSQMCAPANDTAFAEFARTAVARYKSQGVDAWEIWNEENTPGFWKPTPSASAYVALLDASAKAIHAVDPGAFLISGGLTATLTLRGAVDTRVFLQQMCALGANHVVNAIGYHPYTYPYLPTFQGPWATSWNKIAQTPVSMVSILAQYGTPDLPIWLTEYGAPTSGPDDEARPGEVTESSQAEMATASVSAVASSASIGALFWYTDEDLPGNSPLDHYGLRRADGSTKPAFAALRRAILTARADLLTR